MATEIKKVYDIRLLGADAVLKNMQAVNSEFDKAKKLVQALQQTALKNEHLIVDPEKIHAQIQENKLKEPKKQGRFQQKLQEVMQQAEEQKALQQKQQKKK